MSLLEVIFGTAGNDSLADGSVVFQKDVEEGNAIMKMTNDTPVPIQPGSFGDVFQVTAYSSSIIRTTASTTTK